MEILRWLGLCSVLCGLAACSAAPQGPVPHTSKSPGDSLDSSPESYVGLKIPPMPKGHETELGYLIGRENQGRYAIEVVNFGRSKTVWMGRLLYHDEKGRAYWKIIAALPPRTLPKGYYFSGGNCLNHNEPQPEIVAIVKMEKKKTLTQIHRAWKADPQKKIFEQLPIEGIQCINESMNH